MGYGDWIGKTESAEDTIGAWPLRGLAAALDLAEAPRVEVPPLWHWLYCLPVHRRSELAEDGHAKKGMFLPPVDLPRRMWAGGRFQFHDALRVGDRARRVSTIRSVQEKQGRSGRLVFVVVRHEISTERGGLAVSEEHDIVYRDHARAGAAPGVEEAPGDARWSRTVHADDVLLFRYSALTFNGHRIHYDRRYCTEVEGYPGLVVHGPLMATLLMELVRANSSRPVASFAFRAVRPVFDTAPFTVCGKPDGDVIQLWAQTGGALAMTATAELAP